MTWKDGDLWEAIVRPRFGGPIEVVGETLVVACEGTPVPVAKTDTGFSFDAEGGRSYRLAPATEARGERSTSPHGRGTA
jgi:hypothetical protein